MTIAVRRAGASDQAACARIFVETVAATFPDEPAESRTEDAYYHSTVGEEQWVALDNGEIIGFISVYWPTNFIHSLYIQPDRQGRGAGQKLLCEVLRLAKGDMELKTDKMNTRAHAIYRHLGWRVVGEGQAATGPWWRLRTAGGIL